MEQLDKEVIDELSEPAKRVFRSLDYRSQRRMLKKAKERGSSTKRNQSRTASFVGTEIKDTSAKTLQAMLLGTIMSEETYAADGRSDTYIIG